MFHNRAYGAILSCNVREAVPLGNSNVYSKKNSQARNSWKVAFYLNLFHYISYQVLGNIKADELLP